MLIIGGVDKESWCLNSDGTVRHDNVELYHLKPVIRESPTSELIVTAGSPNSNENQNENEKPESEKGDENVTVVPGEGDVIGVAYDHVELNFFLNGKNMEIPIRNIKGTVYPALFGMLIITIFYFITL